MGSCPHNLSLIVIKMDLKLLTVLFWLDAKAEDTVTNFPTLAYQNLAPGWGVLFHPNYWTISSASFSCLWKALCSRWMPHATCLLLRQTKEPLSSGLIMQAVWGRELNASCVSLWPELTHCIPSKVNVWWRRDGEPEIHRAALFSISGTTGRQESLGQGFIWIRNWILAHNINQRRCTVASTVKNESVCNLRFWHAR